LLGVQRNNALSWGLIETAQTRNIMKTMTTNLVISFATLALCGAAVAGTDKTLVSWVCLANTTQQGGSALTIQSADRLNGGGVLS